MPNSSPAWVRQVQVTVVVENTPVASEPATEAPVATYATISRSASTYATVKEITVSTDKVGILDAVEMSCDNYDVAQWKLVVAGVTIFEDVKFPESFTKEFPSLHLSAGQKITLSGKSDGSTTVNFYADFSYKEVG